MAYGSMPPPPQPAQAQAVGAPPPPVVLAVRLMFLNVLLGVIGLIFAFALRSQIRKSLRDKYPDYTSSHLNSLVNTAVGIAVGVAIVFIVLYTLLALQVRKGKNWARIVTFVLAGLGVLSALTSLAQNGAALSKVLGIVQGVVDVVIIVSLARAGDYFSRRSYYA